MMAHSRSRPAQPAAMAAAAKVVFGVCGLCKCTPDLAKDDVVRLVCSVRSCGERDYCGECLRSLYTVSPGGKVIMSASVNGNLHLSAPTLAMRNFKIDNYLCPCAAEQPHPRWPSVFTGCAGRVQKELFRKVTNAAPKPKPAAAKPALNPGNARFKAGPFLRAPMARPLPLPLSTPTQLVGGDWVERSPSSASSTDGSGCGEATPSTLPLPNPFKPDACSLPRVDALYEPSFATVPLPQPFQPDAFSLPRDDALYEPSFAHVPPPQPFQPDTQSLLGTLLHNALYQPQSILAQLDAVKRERDALEAKLAEALASVVARDATIALLNADVGAAQKDAGAAQADLYVAQLEAKAQKCIVDQLKAVLADGISARV